MRIPYPERISYAGATFFAVALVAIQLLEGTSLIFSACTFGYILVMTVAFNLAGGLYRVAGAYIFFNAILTLLLGLVVKAVLGESANSNLIASERSIEVYLLGAVSLLVASYIENRFRPRRALIPSFFPLTTLRGVYIGSAIVGIALAVFWATAPDLRPGSVLTAVHNSDALLPFAMILGVVYTVRSTHGRRSLSPLLGLLFLAVNLEALLGFSKQALFTPAFCWVLGVGLSRYTLKPVNILCIILIVFAGEFYGVPYVQVGKGLNQVNSFSARLALSVYLLEHMEAVRKEYKESSIEEYNSINYFNHPEGIFDRLEMFSIDDLLINETDRDGTFGYEPMKEAWENLVPHIIWKNKPIPYFGNTYAHQLNLLPVDDDSTGVSFSPTADAYHEGGVFGVLFMETACFIGVFLTLSWINGDIRDQPAALILILLASHAAPEGAMEGAFSLITYSIVVFGIAFVCRYIFPVVAATFQPTQSTAAFAMPALAAD